MSKLFKVILAYIVSWMFFFPLSFTFLPSSINSKMLMAVLGLGFIWGDLVQRRKGFVAKKSVIEMFVIALLFSMVCFATTVINNTTTKDYTTYFVSMAVWFTAAYASYAMIRIAHGKVTVELIGKYIIMLCVGQGLISFAFYVSPPVYNFCSHFFALQEANFKSGERLAGLGTSADTGGVRYAISLVFIAYQMCYLTVTTKKSIYYSICFFVILVLGNMMARTTTVGALLAMAYIVFRTIDERKQRISIAPLKALLLTGIGLIPVLLLFNKLFPQTQELYEFAFEGFYHYVETGEWSTSSTNILFEMWKIWPDTIKTWIIGDGLFMNPEDPTLYYMGTDVGYARFVFFCGLLGLAIFVVFFLTIFRILNNRLPHHFYLFFLLLMMVFAVWVKVTTDIFFVFALLLCVRPEDEVQEDAVEQKSVKRHENYI